MTIKLYIYKEVKQNSEQCDDHPVSLNIIKQIMFDCLY